MPHRFLKPALYGSAALLAVVTSFWVGAVVYVKTNPKIIEYLEPLTFTDMEGRDIEAIRPGDSLVMKVQVRRQPWSCWGSYTYLIKGDKATYQFPAIRSNNLVDKVHIHEIQHLFAIPRQIPAGIYHWSVTVFPTCNGADLSPTTMDLHSDITILGPGTQSLSAR
jgi:hypothetical protein